MVISRGGGVFKTLNKMKLYSNKQTNQLTNQQTPKPKPQSPHLPQFHIFDG